MDESEPKPIKLEIPLDVPQLEQMLANAKVGGAVEVVIDVYLPIDVKAKLREVIVR